MSKKNNSKNKDDIDFQILQAEVRLEKLKKQKEKLKNKTVKTTQFTNLPESIENIAAHIAIRLRNPVLIMWEYDNICFNIYNCFDIALGDYEIAFDLEGTHREFNVTPIAHFGLNELEDISIKWFGCVIVPNNDEYTIRPLKINKDAVIVFEED
jgi:hypothetical protein